MVYTWSVFVWESPPPLFFFSLFERGASCVWRHRSQVWQRGTTGRLLLSRFRNTRVQTRSVNAWSRPEGGRERGVSSEVCLSGGRKCVAGKSNERSIITPSWLSGGRSLSRRDLRRIVGKHAGIALRIVVVYFFEDRNSRFSSPNWFVWIILKWAATLNEFWTVRSHQHSSWLSVRWVGRSLVLDFFFLFFFFF